MSDEPTGITPRDREQEAAHRAGRRRRRVAVVAVVGVVAAIGVAELSGGLVSRVIDATGLTCGNGWSEVDGDALADLRIPPWGTPEAREQGFDPEELMGLPPGLAEPSLTSWGIRETGRYDPTLYPLDQGVVLQGDGYTERVWVGADALTGEPLWGIEDDSSGFSTIQGRFMLVAGREDGRTDLTTFDPRTGEELSCVRLDGEVTAMTGVGDSDVAVALRSGEAGEDGEGSSYALVRLDPVVGGVVWSQPLAFGAAGLSADGEVIVASASSVETVVEIFSYGSPPTGPQVVGFDAGSGDEVWRLEQQGEQRVVAVATLGLPDGESGALILEIADRDAWDREEVRYRLVDPAGAELWSAPAALPFEAGAWQVGGAVVLPEGSSSFAVDMGTGDRLWEEGPSLIPGDAVVLGESVLMTDQLIRDEQDEEVFVSYLVDPITGERTEYRAAMRDAQLADSYLLTSSGMTQIVIPLAQ
ncbi:outer membrane protein assembly factor BamB family protein [Pseudactinotalea suaedae]|uniref:outer membrane protein assembly factor BamB family protein n=1 Tax=Pseudactinotalea suaedae TaxID=1524924 RepID=UPI001391FFE3|nr:PQQ-binding-like beta-propeller repeat protein [Pseudactinotalea suaedae]